MRAPTCERCGQVVTVATGLPVFVTFNADGTLATIGIDLSELCDLDPGAIRCGCEEEEEVGLTEEGHDALLDVLHDIAEHVAPSVDYEMGSR